MHRGTFHLVSIVALLLTTGAGATEPAGAGPDAAKISFKGRVLGAQGTPVPDAKVVLYEVNYGGGALPQAEQTQEVATGADGAFLLTAPKVTDAYRQGSIIVQKEGLALGWAVWEMREGDRQVDFALGAPQELGGTAVDEGGTPIVDAEVGVALAIIGSEQDRRYLTYYVAPSLLTVKTDSTGRFVFSNLPAEATCELLGRKEGRATVCTLDTSTYRGGKCQFTPGQTDIKLTLPAEARIEGKAVDKDGQPIAGVQISAQPDRRSLPTAAESATSAQDGAFFLGNLPEGGYTLQLASQRQEVAEWVAEPVKVNLKAGETVRDVQLALSKGAVVEVRVKDDEDGKPVENASVGIRHVATQQWFSSRTDAAGVAHIRLAPGDYELTQVYKQGFSRPGQLAEAFTVSDGETKTIEHVLAGLPSITGVVYDDTGRPLEGTKVQVMPSGQSGAGTSDAEGKFKASWDPQSWTSDRTVFCVVARHPDRNLAAALSMADQVGTMDVKLQPGATLAGQVMDPNGKPIEGAYLQIMLRVSNWGSSFLPHQSVKTDAEGRFEVGAIPPEQRYNITAMAEGYGQTQIDLNEDQVTAGRVDAGAFALPLANLSVTGVVVDSEGNPVSGARLSCYGGSQDNQPNRDTQTDAEGKFTLDGVCAGRISISVSAQSGTTALRGYVQTEGGASNIQIVVAEGSTTQRYVPPRPATLRGKPLPDLKKLGIELPAEAADKVLLVCFWDMNQRPSRYCMGELIRRAPQLAERGYVLVAVHAGQVEEGKLEQWIEENKPPFPVSRITGDLEKTRFQWGAASLPHLILTDEKHFVTGEGFGLLKELDK